MNRHDGDAETACPLFDRPFVSSRGRGWLQGAVARIGRIFEPIVRAEDADQIFHLVIPRLQILVGKLASRNQAHRGFFP